MPVKIRLARRGRRKRPYYHIVVADSRSPRDGKFIENIGSYNPMTSPATIELDHEKALDWMMKGAQPTDTMRAILRFKGVLYKKHLLRGVTKGALTQEKADELWNAWIQEKEEKVAARRNQSVQEKKDRWTAISGKPGAAPVIASADADAAQAFTQQDTPAAEEAEAPAESKEEVPEAPAKEEAVAEVPAKEEAVPETPAKEDAVAEVPAKEEVVAEAPAKEEAVTETPAAEETPAEKELAEVPAGDAPVTEEVKDKAEAAAEEE